MNDHEALVACLDYDATCGPNDGLPSMMDILARDCARAAAAIRSLIQERDEERMAREEAERNLTSTCECRQSAFMGFYNECSYHSALKQLATAAEARVKELEARLLEAEGREKVYGEINDELYPRIAELEIKLKYAEAKLAQVERETIERAVLATASDDCNNKDRRIDVLRALNKSAAQGGKQDE